MFGAFTTKSKSLQEHEAVLLFMRTVVACLEDPNRLPHLQQDIEEAYEFSDAQELELDKAKELVAQAADDMKTAEENLELAKKSWAKLGLEAQALQVRKEEIDARDAGVQTNLKTLNELEAQLKAREEAVAKREQETAELEKTRAELAGWRLELREKKADLDAKEIAIKKFTSELKG